MRTPKILIVDESQPRAEQLGGSLREAGFVPVWANCVEDAVACARAQRPDIIVVNVVIPEVDGYEVCRELRNDRAVRHIPVLAVAATRTPADELWARMQGASDVVSQPCSVEQLLGAIRTMLT